MSIVREFNGFLEFGKHKPIDCQVQLEIDVFDPYLGKDYNLNEYQDGIKASGKIVYESFAIDNRHPVKTNALGSITSCKSKIRDRDFCKFNILIVERISVEPILDNRIKRYTWLFYVVGKPIVDSIQFFPEVETLSMNKIFVCTNFRGYWSVGVSSVIVAQNEDEAHAILIQQLHESEIPVEPDLELEFREVNIKNKGAYILNDGNWM